jgi:hypothetical protein
MNKKIRLALDKTGLPWETRQGGKHKKIILAGKLVAVLPIGTREQDPFGHKHVISSIRRKAAAHTKSREAADILITHIVPGYDNRTVHGYAMPSATDEEIREKCLVEVMGFPLAPFGTREYMRHENGAFSVVVHTN